MGLLKYCYRFFNMLRLDQTTPSEEYNFKSKITSPKARGYITKAILVYATIAAKKIE